VSDWAILTSELEKRFRGNVVAVQGVSLRIQCGEIYGFLGLNGAGKSTTIRMLLGMIAPTAGHAELFGERVRAEAPGLWRRVGHLVETATAYPELSVRQNLEVAARLQRMRDPRAVDQIIEQLELGAYADRRAAHLSLGNLQRLAIARALVHSPELLILDEPANGLDPAGVVQIRELLRELSTERGVTVLISSHILAEVDRLATRIGIIHRGRLIEELDSDALDRHRDRRLEVGAREYEQAEQVLLSAGYSSTRRTTSNGPLLELRETAAIDRPEDIAELLVQAGIHTTRLAIERESLEQHFIRLTSE
jgi:ABC-2 type transport system ATP-binding protein